MSVMVSILVVAAVIWWIVKGRESTTVIIGNAVLGGGAFIFALGSFAEGYPWLGIGLLGYAGWCGYRLVPAIRARWHEATGAQSGVRPPRKVSGHVAVAGLPSSGDSDVRHWLDAALVRPALASGGSYPAPPGDGWRPSVQVFRRPTAGQSFSMAAGGGLALVTRGDTELAVPVAEDGEQEVARFALLAGAVLMSPSLAMSEQPAEVLVTTVGVRVVMLQPPEGIDDGVLAISVPYDVLTAVDIVQQPRLSGGTKDGGVGLWVNSEFPDLDGHWPGNLRLAGAVVRSASLLDRIDGDHPQQVNVRSAAELIIRAARGLPQDAPVRWTHRPEGPIVELQPSTREPQTPRDDRIDTTTRIAPSPPPDRRPRPRRLVEDPAVARARKAAQHYASSLPLSFITCSRDHQATPGAWTCPVCNELLPHIPASYVLDQD